MVSRASRGGISLGANSPPLRAIVFDFDGVILESAELKEHAFVELFVDYPQHAEAIRRHHLENQGISRFEKFAWIHRELLGRELSAEESRTLGERFSQLVFEQTLRCPMVPGALDLLRALEGVCPAFVASGTPEAELQEIVAQRGLAPCFAEVHGSPKAKEEILRDLQRRHALAADEMLMVGDSASDLRGALAAGVPFLLRETEAQEEHFRGTDVSRVRDLFELSEQLGLSEAVRPSAVVG